MYLSVVTGQHQCHMILEQIFPHKSRLIPLKHYPHNPHKQTNKPTNKPDIYIYSFHPGGNTYLYGNFTVI